MKASHVAFPRFRNLWAFVFDIKDINPEKHEIEGKN